MGNLVSRWQEELKLEIDKQKKMKSGNIKQNEQIYGRLDLVKMNNQMHDQYYNILDQIYTKKNMYIIRCDLLDKEQQLLDAVLNGYDEKSEIQYLQISRIRIREKIQQIRQIIQHKKSSDSNNLLQFYIITHIYQRNINNLYKIINYKKHQSRLNLLRRKYIQKQKLNQQSFKIEDMMDNWFKSDSKSKQLLEKNQEKFNKILKQTIQGQRLQQVLISLKCFYKQFWIYLSSPSPGINLEIKKFVYDLECKSINLIKYLFLKCEYERCMKLCSRYIQLNWKVSRKIMQDTVIQEKKVIYQQKYHRFMATHTFNKQNLADQQKQNKLRYLILQTIQIIFYKVRAMIKLNKQKKLRKYIGQEIGQLLKIIKKYEYIKIYWKDLIDLIVYLSDKNKNNSKVEKNNTQNNDKSSNSDINNKPNHLSSFNDIKIYPLIHNLKQNSTQSLNPNIHTQTKQFHQQQNQANKNSNHQQLADQIQTKILSYQCNPACAQQGISQQKQQYDYGYDSQQSQQGEQLYDKNVWEAQFNESRLGLQESKEEQQTQQNDLRKFQQKNLKNYEQIPKYQNQVSRFRDANEILYVVVFEEKMKNSLQEHQLRRFELVSDHLCKKQKGANGIKIRGDEVRLKTRDASRLTGRLVKHQTNQKVRICIFNKRQGHNDYQRNRRSKR